MKRSMVLVACVGTLVFSPAARGGAWDTVVFKYDFTAAPAGALDPAVWIINHPGEWWWVQGRTQFPNYGSWYPASEFPRVENGVCVIDHHLYNPHDNGVPKTTFLGGEIRTVMQFAPDRAYRFEATVRCFTYPRGLDSSFFLYGWDGAHSDEIDIELISNRTNDNVTYPDGDPVLTNPWNESRQKPVYVVPAGLDLSQWNTFRIYWYPAWHRVDWTWLDPVHGETLLRRETSTSAVPDETMALYFNFWAPADSWPDAYDAGLQPAQTADQDQVVTYHIQRVDVRSLTLAQADYDRDGDVDSDDFALFQACFSKPAVPLAAGCEGMDFDGDDDVDQSDFGFFQRCFSGANESADPGCVN